MPTALDGAGLLSAILADPEDDVARLVFADWLDDEGRGERAEFIRQEVLGAHSVIDPQREWPDSVTTLADGHNRGWPDDRGWSWVWRRGFVAQVSCPLAEWLDHGPALRGAHPITRVEATDRKPWQGRDQPDSPVIAWGWWNMRVIASSTWREPIPPGGRADQLPAALLRLLDADPRKLTGLPVNYDAHDDTGGVFFGSPDVALDALSDALIAWAGLSPGERGDVPPERCASCGVNDALPGDDVCGPCREDSDAAERGDS